MRRDGRQMVCLGICDSQDAGAALFVGSELIAAVNEERLNREKLWGGFPARSIQTVLELAGIPPSRVDVVVVGTSITPNVLMRLFRGPHQALRRSTGQFGYLLNLFIAYQALARKTVLPMKAEAALARAVLGWSLRRMGVSADLVSVDHHLAHAWAAFATSPFDECLVVTSDGLGDGLGVTVSVGRREQGLRRVFEQSGFSALTLYYSRLTEALGFTPIKDEGKVCGLAAYGRSTPLLWDARRMLRTTNGRFNVQNHLLPASKDDPPYSKFSGYPREDVALSFQEHFEEVMAQFVDYWLRRTGMRNLAVAGGSFANVKMNQRLAELESVDELWVFPHMGDGGLAVGGCASYLSLDPTSLQHVFYGPDIDPDRAEQVLRRAGLMFTRPRRLFSEVARKLAQKRTVAWCSGRMEFGPRALGNRSILFHAADPTTIDWLNNRLRRSKFMPFAPAVLERAADEYLVGTHKARHAARFMTVSFNVTDKMRTLYPGAVHVDGTARPQLVDEQGSPNLYGVLTEYERLTGCPVLINTSFNMHEEPIVCSETDAVRAFLQAQLDYLVLGPFLTWREGGANGDSG